MFAECEFRSKRNPLCTIFGVSFSRIVGWAIIGSEVNPAERGEEPISLLVCFLFYRNDPLHDLPRRRRVVLSRDHANGVSRNFFFRYPATVVVAGRSLTPVLNHRVADSTAADLPLPARKRPARAGDARRAPRLNASLKPKAPASGNGDTRVLGDYRSRQDSGEPRADPAKPSRVTTKRPVCIPQR